MQIPDVQIKNILYATDLSESAQYAFSYAISLASQYGAKITFLHVLADMPSIVDSSGAMGYIGEQRWQELQNKHQQDAKDALIGKRRDHHLIRDILDQFSEKVKNDFEKRDDNDDEIVVEKGNSVEKILAVASEKNCDLIVMGTHGRSKLADVVMGSTARRVIRRSELPVLVVRKTESK